MCGKKTYSIFLFLVPTLLICGGTIMIFLYHTDDIHTNANGFITAQNCSAQCRYGEGGTCSIIGSAVAMYQLNDDPGVWIETWFDPRLSFLGVCTTSECCLLVIEEKVLVYFLVEDEVIKDFALVPEYNRDVLLGVGIAFLIVGIPWFLLMTTCYFLKKGCEYESIN